MGEATLPVDSFSRKIGFNRLAKKNFENLSPEIKDLLQGYADGVNDFVSGLGFSKESTAKLLPPEFTLLGISKFDAWEPEDSMCLIKLMNFHLSWNWQSDLMRDYISQIPELKDYVEELVPFTKEYSHNLVTIMTEVETRKQGYAHDISLLERYYVSNGRKDFNEFKTHLQEELSEEKDNDFNARLASFNSKRNSSR